MGDFVIMYHFKYPSYFHFLMDIIMVYHATLILISYPNGNSPISRRPSTIPKTSYPTSCILFSFIKLFLTVPVLLIYNSFKAARHMAHRNLSSSNLWGMGYPICRFMIWKTLHWKCVIKWSPGINKLCVISFSSTRFLDSYTSPLARTLSCGCQTKKFLHHSI